MPGPATLRYGGLAGSLLLAVAAFFHGADSPWSPTMTARTILAGDDGWLTPLCWLAGTLLLVAAWWLGRHRVPSLRWAYVTAALWAVPLLFVLPLGSDDVYSYACQGWVLGAGHDPYAAGVQAYGCPWLDAVSPTWRESPAPYGPVFLLFAALAAAAGGSLTGALALLRVIAVLGVVLLAWRLPALARRCGVDPARAVWLAVACPLVPIHLISGAHNDAVMVGLIVAALTLTGRGRTALIAAGALIGLAAGVKATALVVLPFAMLPLRRGWWAALGAAAALGLASLASGLGFGWVTALAGSGVSVQWTSPPTAVGMTAALLGAGPGAIDVARVLGLVVLAALLTALWWHTWRDAGLDARPEVRTGKQSKGAGLALAATVALSPVFHPWYLMWPLAVLAATLRRDTLWLVVPCAVASVLCLPDGYNLALAVKSQGAIAMTLLIVTVVVMAMRKKA
ncbi:polyprenol phosphomannose-dependent alpha 1,6 mannosyltransferase MptB [Actinoplanes sp. NBRC 103695]|uniref:polyprenol phosphomannose-dependent alpha 1,6 mannosyltransferase MptB n=1 Tax=Actinoplanes sp. NBRC 103695 TaxID=3032202 RepID=UPI0024A1572E|nr:polyprenol phosphomannose-dependent alpha 1,6 mannosyltransferase MptB [Actinoplanes sp. NBRC 103695]GLY93272.1 hypothetical protein Acsp02_05280 [Actinoplanes sp. NBRC 103695]